MSTPIKSTVFLLTLPLLLLVIPLAGQENPPPAPDPQGQFSAAGEEAIEKWQREGDLAGAVEILDQARRDDLATPVDLALLATLYLETARPAPAFEILEPLAASEGADPAVLYNAGRAAIALGRREAAVSYFERSVARIGNSPAARELGLLRGAEGRIAEAYQLLRPWAEQNPGDLEARRAAIAAALKLGRAAEIEELFAGLPREDPGVVLLLGQYLSQSGDPRGAIEVLETLRETHPPQMRLDFHRLLADAYIDVGRSSDAVALLEGLRPLGPGLAVILAEAQHRSGQLDAAIATLAPFAEPLLGDEKVRGPLIYQTALDYGRFLVAAGRAEDALPFLELATRLDDSQQLAFKTLGDALVATGRRDEARPVLERFRELAELETERRRRKEAAAKDPTAGALVEAREFMEAGEPQKALAELRQEIALAPDDIRPRLLEAQILLMQGRSQEAFAAAEKTLTAFPGHPDALYQRGVAQMALDQPEAAELDFRRVLAAAPQHTAAMNDLAVVLITQGKKAAAREYLERLLTLRPEDELAKQNLQRLLEESGG